VERFADTGGQLATVSSSFARASASNRLSSRAGDVLAQAAMQGFSLIEDQLAAANYITRKRLSLPVARRGMLSTTVTVTVGSGSPARASASWSF
jgi:hypothetical protein